MRARYHGRDAYDVGEPSHNTAAFREAVRRDTTNHEARGRLRDIGQRP